MNDVKDAVIDRIKSPYIGYMLFAFVSLNWKAFFILYSLEGNPVYRLAVFNHCTDIYSLLVYPMLIGIGIAILSPWIKWAFTKISETPFVGLKISEARSANRILIAKLNIEKIYNEHQNTMEQQALTEAKLIQELETITDPEARDKVSSQIHAIRDIIDRDKSETIARIKSSISFKDLLSSERFGTPTISRNEPKTPESPKPD